MVLALRGADMAAMVVASSTAMGMPAVGRRELGPCSSPTARPQLVQLPSRKNVSSVVGTSVVLGKVNARSRESSFPVTRSALVENPSPVYWPLANP